MGEKDDMVTITLPRTMADILGMVCSEWVHDHARYSKATEKMTSMFLGVILAQIREQLGEPEDAIEGHVCSTCNDSFKSLRGLKAHKTRMKH